MTSIPLGVCDHGVWATFQDAASGQKHTLSVLCIKAENHPGPHQAPDGFTWEDDEVD